MRKKKYFTILGHETHHYILYVYIYNRGYNIMKSLS